MKHSLGLAVLLVPLLATAAFAGIYYEEEVKSGAQATKLVFYISGAKARIEMRRQGTAGVMIQRFDQGKIYQLTPQNKMYLERAIPELTPEQEAQVQVTVTKTEETKRIGNYNCTRYEVTIKGFANMPPEGVTVQQWMTSDADVADEFEKFSYAENRALSAKVATQLAKLEGFPMEVVTTTPSGSTTATVTTVKKQDIPDSMFEVPADYQKVTMPAPRAAPPVTPPAAPAPGGAQAGKGE